MSQVRLLLADEQRICLAALKKLLASEVSIVGTAVTSSELISEVERLAPSVVLIRMSLSEADRFRALKAIRDNYPRTKVVVIAADANPRLPERALSSGASSCVLATADPKTLLKAIHEAAKTQPARSYTDQSAGDRAGWKALLNARQREILALTVQGLSQKQIAARLNISPKTVEFHKYRMMRQLGVRTSAELIVAGIRMGLGEQ